MWLNLYVQSHYGLPYYIFHVRELGQEITMLREIMRAVWGSHIAYTSIIFFLYDDFLLLVVVLSCFQRPYKHCR